MVKISVIVALTIGLATFNVFSAANVPNEATAVTYDYRNGMTARLKCTSSDKISKNFCFLDIKKLSKRIVLNIDYESAGYAWRDLTMNFVTFGTPFEPGFYFKLGVMCGDKDIALVKSDRDLDCAIFYELNKNRLVAKNIDVIGLSNDGEIVSGLREISATSSNKNQ